MNWRSVKLINIFLENTGLRYLSRADTRRTFHFQQKARFRMPCIRRSSSVPRIVVQDISEITKTRIRRNRCLTKWLFGFSRSGRKPTGHSSQYCPEYRMLSFSWQWQLPQMQSPRPLQISMVSPLLGMHVLFVSLQSHVSPPHPGKQLQVPHSHLPRPPQTLNATTSVGIIEYTQTRVIYLPSTWKVLYRFP